MVEPITVDLEAHKLIEAQRKSLEESQLAIIKRVFKAHPSSQSGRRADQRNSLVQSRETGRYLVKIGDHRATIMGSQKAAYIQLLEWLNEDFPGLFDTLAHWPASRGRRIVARTKAELYAKADLAIHASPLSGGWFADLNLSRDQKILRLRKVCAEVGLTYGIDANAGL